MVTDYPTGTVTLVFTDIQDSSLLSERHGASFEPVRAAHFRLLRETAAKWNGQEVSIAGDSSFLVFARPEDAVQWAAEVQVHLLNADWQDPSPSNAVIDLRLRIGMHTGVPFLSPDSTRPDYFGPPVNRAARVAAAGHGGQILLSSATYDLAVSPLSSDFQFRDCGPHRLRGVGDERLWQLLHPKLPREFPPLRTLNPERHNLPVQETPYIGREEEVRAWQNILLNPATRLLTFTGFGGMGKTRSALHLAELCSEMFEDGVWWVELEEARTGEEMILSIAAAVNLPLQTTASVREQVYTYLRERHLLLVLDNSEQLTEAAAILHELLNVAAKLKCIVTSRRALELRSETVIEIRPLPDRDAVRLFVERARTYQDSFLVTNENASDVRELCLRLDGVPLAIELAAARIVGMTPRQMVSRLSERFRLLQTRAPDLPPRQRALRAAIDWSYDLLTETQRRLFAQMAVFAGGFTMEDAEAVCDAEDVFENVIELRRHSLFRTETDPLSQENRFVMLDSLREYALERLLEFDDGGDSIRQKHAQHFLQFAKEAIQKFRAPEEIIVLRRLEASQANLRAAAEWARASGLTPLFAELALLLGVILQRRGFRADAVHPVQAALESLLQTRKTDTPLYAQLLRERAALHYELDEETTAARQKAEEAKELFFQWKDPGGIAHCENIIGLTAMKEQDYSRAREYLTRALSHAEKAEDTIQVAIIHNNLGLVERRDKKEGDREKAENHLTQALRLRRQLDDRRGLAETLNNLGVLAHFHSDLDTAWTRYAEALHYELSLRHVYGAALVLNNLGEVAFERSEYERACRLFGASERIMDDVKAPELGYVRDWFLRAVREEADSDVETWRHSVRGKPLEELIAWAMPESENNVTNANA